MKIPNYQRNYSWSNQIVESVSINDLSLRKLDDIEIVSGEERLRGVNPQKKQ